jgi:DNA polymerase-3 subunit epsilon/oligoribonuclease
MLGIFLDQETTGLDSKKHRVLEIAFCVIDLATGEEKVSFDSVVKHSEDVWLARDPMSIQINGFTWDQVQTGKSEQELSIQIQKLLKNVGIVRGQSVFICQNPSFDRPFFAQLIDPYTQERLYWPYHWLDLASMYWALEVQKAKELDRTVHRAVPGELRLSKDSIAEAFQLPPEKRPHRARNGVEHLVLCYRHVVGFPAEKQAPQFERRT